VPAGGAEDVIPARRSALPARTRIVAAIACVLLGGTALLALVAGGGRGREEVATPVSSTGNLLTNGGFEVASERVDKKGLARGVTGWGDARLTLVGAPVQTGKRAQRLEVGLGRVGGLWFEVPVEAGKTYEQSGWIQVGDLNPGSRAEMIVEWYGADANLLDYHAFSLTEVDAALVRRSQTVDAPATAARARYLVNITRGGSLVVDGAGLQMSAPAAPAPAPAPMAPDPAPR
jgi:hypothetical protein